MECSSQISMKFSAWKVWSRDVQIQQPCEVIPMSQLSPHPGCGNNVCVMRRAEWALSHHLKALRLCSQVEHRSTPALVLRASLWSSQLLIQSWLWFFYISCTQNTWETILFYVAAITLRGQNMRPVCWFFSPSFLINPCFPIILYSNVYFFSSGIVLFLG